MIVCYAPAGNRTRITSLGSLYSTTKPLVLILLYIFGLINFYISVGLVSFMAMREIRWSVEIDPAEQERQRYRWTWAIVNVPIEIRRIKQRILKQISPASDMREIGDYPIPNSGGLHAYLFSVSSDKLEIEDPFSIYRNLKRFRRDRDLLDRSEGALLSYIERLVA